MGILFVWLQFLALGAVIGFAGYHLSRQADAIAEITGLGRNWIGLILLATVTSLPELMTGISAVRLAENPNLAVGNILGACVLNLSLVVLLDFLHKEGSVYQRATQGHLLSGALVMILISYVGFSLLVSPYFKGPGLGPIGFFSAAIPVLYLLALRALYRFELKGQEKTGGGSRKGPPWRNYLAFAVSAAVVILAGSALPFVGEAIVDAMGWNSAFVGTVFMALGTSLPEIAVTVSAIRIKAAELAFSNILGTNLFNVAILAIDDFFYPKGPLFQSVDPTHAITAFSAVMMAGLVSVALIQPPHRKVFNTVSLFSLLLAGIFLLNAYIIFRLAA